MKEELEQEFYSGVSPLDAAKGNPGANIEDAEWQTIIGLQEAVAATKRSIAQHDDPVYHEHLDSLRAQMTSRINESIAITKSKIQDTKVKKGNSSSLEWHLNNLYGKLAEVEGELEQKEAA